jgi:peroxiredoxin
MKKLVFSLLSMILMVSVASPKDPYRPGDAASDFSLKNVKGESVSLSQFNSAKGFIVVFYSNVCPMVKKYEQRIADLHKEFSSKGYPVVAINSNDKDAQPGDSFDEMKKYVKGRNTGFEYLYDETQDVARDFGATNTPHVYVLSKKDGNLKVEYVGAIDNNADDASQANKKYVADAVNALLKGQSVPLSSTKAIGCTVKWKKV